LFNPLISLVDDIITTDDDSISAPDPHLSL
jgi:hypothetical protein